MTLQRIDRTDQTPLLFLETCGTIVAEFGERTQGSGNISYGLRTPDGTRYFVKTAGLPEDIRWTLTHAERIDALRNAVRIAHRGPPALRIRDLRPRVEPIRRSPARRGSVAAQKPMLAP